MIAEFSKMNVAIFICYVGLVSALCQTVVLNFMIQRIGAKYSIVVGLSAQLAQLVCYGLTTSQVAVWVGGLGVALSSITYAAISAFASIISDKDKQVESVLIPFPSCLAAKNTLLLLSGSSAGHSDGGEGSVQWPGSSRLWSDVASVWD